MSDEAKKTMMDELDQLSMEQLAADEAHAAAKQKRADRMRALKRAIKALGGAA